MTAFHRHQVVNQVVNQMVKPGGASSPKFSQKPESDENWPEWTAGYTDQMLQQLVNQAETPI